MSKIIQVWGKDKPKDIPDDFEFLPCGDPQRTRYVKSKSSVVYVQMERGRRYTSAVGVWAKRELIEESNHLSRSTEEQRAKARLRRQELEYKKARIEIRRQFPRIPTTDLEDVVERAFTVGNGTVGRTSTLVLEDKCRLAVVAHVRHQHTFYDDLMHRFGDRGHSRDEVRDAISEVLDLWSEASMKEVETQELVAA